MWTFVQYIQHLPRVVIELPTPEQEENGRHVVEASVFSLPLQECGPLSLPSHPARRNNAGMRGGASPQQDLPNVDFSLVLARSVFFAGPNHPLLLRTLGSLDVFPSG